MILVRTVQFVVLTDLKFKWQRQTNTYPVEMQKVFFFIFSFRRTDLAYFDGLSETILSAGLVKPKPGRFEIIPFVFVIFKSDLNNYYIFS